LDLFKTYFLIDYWRVTSPEKYDITTYDLALCQREYTTKSIAHTCLATYLTNLLKADLENDVKTALGVMRTKLKVNITLTFSEYKLIILLKNIQKDTNNQNFWNGIAPTLAKKFLDKAKYNVHL
jgi:hypothetical protein